MTAVHIMLAQTTLFDLILCATTTMSAFSYSLVARLPGLERRAPIGPACSFCKLNSHWLELCLPRTRTLPLVPLNCSVAIHDAGLVVTGSGARRWGGAAARPTRR